MDSITLDGRTHKMADMTDTQRTMVKHIHDLERKIGSLKFNLEQIEIGREAFITLLRSELSK